LARVAPEIPWPIYAAGDCSAPGGTKTRLDSLHRLGRLATPELAACMSRAAVFALPARYEPFGLAALEAGLAGCVLILGDIPSLREIWRDAAIFVPPDDPEKLSAALSRLTRDARLRASMSRRARRRALLFSVERMAHGYADLYRRLSARWNIAA
jgi:glycosyltransferase involved in cell wall biosynthesis